MSKIQVNVQTGEVVEIPLTQEEVDERNSQVIIIPNAVSPRQIRMALTRTDLRVQIEQIVQSGDQDLKDWYEYSTIFERNNPQVEAMATALGLTPQQVDDLWILASSL